VGGRAIRAAIATFLLLAPGFAAVAQDAVQARPVQTGPQPEGFSGLWTRWSGANRASIAAEAARVPTEPGVRGPLRPGSASLGERVGEMVRTGDCEGGERLAREAGDFPLVDAVRAHCGRTVQPAVSRR
jgi:hypothetical protein